ncbi:3,4-dihydroxy-2-butanone-4-phosphate synthase [Lactiplantibacillus plantarum]|uniref:3,4-dihydroxy-2-butanone-4-phosphate synthase n=1 Tax=Lactiplantibacillus plantarum TaxID=1590 RepID=UPI0040467C0E
MRADQRDGGIAHAQRGGTRYGTNFTQSIEAAEGVETGISAADRARTIQVAVARDAKPSDLVQPGHIFPVRAVPGGVLVRAGHTEAGCDLTAMAGLTPAAGFHQLLSAFRPLSLNELLGKFLSNTRCESFFSSVMPSLS